MCKGRTPARTHIQPLCANTRCSLDNLPEAMDNWEGWRERAMVICADSVTWRWWWHCWWNFEVSNWGWRKILFRNFDDMNFIRWVLQAKYDGWWLLVSRQGKTDTLNKLMRKHLIHAMQRYWPKLKLIMLRRNVLIFYKVLIFFFNMMFIYTDII